MDLFNQLVEQYGLLPVLTFVLAPLLALFAARVILGGRAGAGTLSAVTGVRPTKCLLCGPCGSGKTTIWQRLVNGESTKPTHTSMAVNTGKAVTEAGSFELVDYPGHGRLASDLAKHLAAAKVVVVVADAVAALDDTVGVHAVADLLARLMEDPAAAGARIVVAANKRDEVTSFSAKAIKKKVEEELTKLFAARTSAVGTAKVASVAPGGAAGGKSAATAKRRDTGLFLVEGEKFTFESSYGAPIDFVDVAAIRDDTYNLQPIIDAALA